MHHSDASRSFLGGIEMMTILLSVACLGLLTWALTLRTRLAEAQIQNTNLSRQIDRRHTERSAELDDEYTYLHNRRDWRQPAIPQITVTGFGLDLIQ